MYYSPLTIHCTSMCLDMIQTQRLKTISHDQIDEYYDDVYDLIRERIDTFHTDKVKPSFLHSVTFEVLQTLHVCKNEPQSRDAIFLLDRLEKHIASLNTH